MCYDREQFARDNINLVYSFIEKFNIKYKYDEIIDLLYIGFTKALNAYDINRGEFSTFAYTYMKKELLYYLTYNRQLKRDYKVACISLNTIVGTEYTELIEFIPSGVNVEEQAMNNILMDYIKNSKNILTEKQLAIFNLYYLYDMDSAYIAKLYNISVKTVWLHKITAYNRLLNYFSNPNFKAPFI